MRHRRLTALASAAAALALALTGCAGTTADPAASETAAAGATVQIEDNHGTHEVPVAPERVAATDNRTFELLDEWGVQLVAAPKTLVPEGVSYKTDDAVADLGSHNEPDLEALVAADPQLVIVGQRFTQYYDDIAALVPDAVLLELDPRDGEPFADELKRQVTALGAVFDREAEATQINAAFDESIDAVTSVYDPAQTVMAVITSGGTINYAAPSTGRTLGPVFDILGLTPALDADGSTDHQGDDISVEAIADSNPDWILVLDRDAGVGATESSDYRPANELLASSEALANVTAVQQGHIVYMPANTYVNEGVQTYTTFFNEVAAAMRAAA